MLALTSSPALLSSLTVFGEEEEEEETYGHLHTLISEPVKPERGEHAAAAEHLQPQLTSLVLFIIILFFFGSPASQADQHAHITPLKGNDATLFDVFKPFIFIGFMLFFSYLNHFKNQSRETDALKSHLAAGCGVDAQFQT